MDISQATFYAWRKKFEGLGVAELRWLRQPEEENRKLNEEGDNYLGIHRLDRDIGWDRCWLKVAQSNATASVRRLSLQLCWLIRAITFRASVPDNHRSAAIKISDSVTSRQGDRGSSESDQQII